MLSFIFGCVAGAGTPYAVPHIRKALEGILMEDIRMNDADFQLFCFAICLIGAGILVLFTGGGAPLSLALGGFLGAFGKRIYNTVRKQGGKTL